MLRYLAVPADSLQSAGNELELAIEGLSRKNPHRGKQTNQDRKLVPVQVLFCLFPDEIELGRADGR